MFNIRCVTATVTSSFSLALAACGGGGGVSLAEGSLDINALAIDPVLGGEVLRTGDAEVLVIGDRAAPETVTLRLGAESLTFDPSQGDSITLKGGLYELTKADLSAAATLDLSHPYVTNGSARTAMAWTAPQTGFLTVEVDGLRTAAADLPDVDDITYVGEAIGYFHWDPDGLDYIYASRADMTLTASLAGGTVVFETTGSVGYRPDTGHFEYSPINANGTGTITGAQFSGIMTNGFEGSGTFSGSFYGPAGENVGGTMEYDGSLATGVASFSGG